MTKHLKKPLLLFGEANNVTDARISLVVFITTCIPLASTVLIDCRRDTVSFRSASGIGNVSRNAQVRSTGISEMRLPKFLNRSEKRSVLRELRLYVGATTSEYCMEMSLLRAEKFKEIVRPETPAMQENAINPVIL